jgi:hypothetical protein
MAGADANVEAGGRCDFQATLISVRVSISLDTNGIAWRLIS